MVLEDTSILMVQIQIYKNNKSWILYSHASSSHPFFPHLSCTRTWLPPPFSRAFLPKILSCLFLLHMASSPFFLVSSFLWSLESTGGWIWRQQCMASLYGLPRFPAQVVWRAECCLGSTLTASFLLSSSPYAGDLWLTSVSTMVIMLGASPLLSALCFGFLFPPFATSIRRMLGLFPL